MDPNYSHSPSYTGYPNPFGQPPAPPSPVWSPVSAASPKQGLPVWMPQPPPQGTQGGIWIPTSPDRGQQGGPVFSPSSMTRETREKDREPRRRHPSPPRSSRDRERDHRGSHREKEKPKSRWKENLTAAGIGGAAASLLNVLTEAAEGL